MTLWRNVMQSRGAWKDTLMAGDETTGLAKAAHGWVTIMVLRLACLTAFLAALSSLAPAEVTARYSLLALAVVVCVPYALWFRTAGFTDGVAQGQILADLLLITVAAWLAGGEGSAVFHLYPLVVLSAAIVLPLKRALLTAILALLVSSVPHALGAFRAIPTRGLAADATLASLALQVALLALVFCAGVFVVRRCGYTDPRTLRLRRLAEVMFKSLPSGLILVDRSGRMLMANERACAMFGQSEQELKDRPVSSVFADASGAPAWSRTTDRLATHRMRRADGSTFPAHVDTARLSLGDSDSRSESTVEWRVLALNDISGLLEMQQQVQDSERLRTAASLATQIAHEVRNPVAAISGSAQVLQKLEKRSRAGDTKSDEILGSERTRLYDCIVEESNRLDEIIAKFLSFTEYSDDTLQMVLRMSESVQPPKPSRASPSSEPAAAQASAEAATRHA